MNACRAAPREGQGGRAKGPRLVSSPRRARHGCRACSRAPLRTETLCDPPTVVSSTPFVRGWPLVSLPRHVGARASARSNVVAGLALSSALLAQRRHDEALMILVTGGTGAIGGELLRLLSQAQIPARALARDPHKAQTLPGITWMTGDLSNTRNFDTRFRRCREAIPAHQLLRRHG